MSIMECPACGASSSSPDLDLPTTFTCKRCHASIPRLPLLPDEKATPPVGVVPPASPPPIGPPVNKTNWDTLVPWLFVLVGFPLLTVAGVTCPGRLKPEEQRRLFERQLQRDRKSEEDNAARQWEDLVKKQRQEREIKALREEQNTLVEERRNKKPNDVVMIRDFQAP